LTFTRGSRPFTSATSQKKDKEEEIGKLILANYISKEGAQSVALIAGNLAYDIQAWAKKSNEIELDRISSVDGLISTKGALEVVRRNAGRISSEGIAQRVDSLRLKSPILHPSKILLAAINYVAHGKEQEVKPPTEPYFFTKFSNCIIGNGDPILIPRVSKKVDWEVELAVVIGKRGKYISRDKARDYIAGYTIANDVSFRDLQFPPGYPTQLNALGQNWVKGKGLDNSFPLGPWLVTPEELKDPSNLDLSLSVNGVVRQKSNTSDMVFKVEDLIEYLSNGITLEPGDIISTGTPLGVAAFTGVPYLKDGDAVEASVQGIGVLKNHVRSEDSVPTGST
jgi:2-keto-4-pentenoate hydratase/2-oxohepta-3-ene-1,7-dioic acid hydratase in catechol pathway